MNVLLCVCVVKIVLLWKQKGFIFAYRNKFVLINIACLIAFTINFEGLTP